MYIDRIDRIYEWLSCSSMLFSQKLMNENCSIVCEKHYQNSYRLHSSLSTNANNYEHSTDIIGAVWIGFFRVFRHFSLRQLDFVGRFLSCSQYIRISQLNSDIPNISPPVRIFRSHNVPFYMHKLYFILYINETHMDIWRKVLSFSITTLRILCGHWSGLWCNLCNFGNANIIYVAIGYD